MLGHSNCPVESECLSLIWTDTDSPHSACKAGSSSCSLGHAVSGSEASSGNSSAVTGAERQVNMRRLVFGSMAWHVMPILNCRGCKRRSISWC
jgi:hypothetical protein